ncbi:MAG: type II toxin-antitoxin system prevent-host-death family antitoxin [Alphaproteobacteria bacterium]|nr:type II toxin-antitoxin system prevent-host-death family antitoxin [Alphaproteobacteria bacterium]
MGTYSVVEAKNKLSQLIKRAMVGEDVVITSHGQPVVELKPVKRAPKRMTEADFAWLAAHRARLTPMTTDAGTFVSQMRDEEWER